MRKKKKTKPQSLFDSIELEDPKDFELKDAEFDNEDILGSLDFDLKDRERCLEDLKKGMDRSERKLRKAKREFKKIQKDYFIRFMIEGIKRITEKRDKIHKTGSS